MTKKQYRELLNQQDADARVKATESNSKYRPSKRLYGDYLYSQDRDMFNNNYNEYINAN